jgi:hypothetical protein
MEPGGGGGGGEGRVEYRFMALTVNRREEKEE